MQTLFGLFFSLIQRTSEAFAHAIDWLEGFSRQAMEFPFYLFSRLFARTGDDDDAAAKETGLLNNLEWLFFCLVSLPLQIVTHCFRIVFPKRFLGIVFGAVEFVFASLVFGGYSVLARTAERLFPSWMLDPLYRLGGWLGSGLRQCLEFFTAWRYSRSQRPLAFAVPALALAIPLAATLVIAPLYSLSGRKEKHYYRAYVQALEADDKPQERLYLNKLEQLGHQRLERAEFASAMSMSKDDNFEAAYDEMKKLAPESSPGFLDAHLWIANAALQGKLSIDDPWELIETHVQHALTINRHDPYVRRMNLELARYRGDAAVVQSELAGLVEHFPQFNSELAHYCRLAGDFPKAKQHARRALTHFEPLLSKIDTPHELTQDERFRPTAVGLMRLAECCDLAGDPDLEIRLLEAAKTIFPTDQQLTNVLAFRLNSLVSDCNFESEEGRATFTRIFRADAKHRIAIGKFARAVFARNPAALKLMADLEQQDALPTLVYRYLADLGMLERDFPLALKFYLRTCQVEPNNAEAWNNVAWLRANTGEVNLEQACQAAHRAVQLRNDVRFLETRGQILMQLERFDEAIQDLEEAINGRLPDTEAAHRSLAQIYERLGKEEQAEAHRALVHSRVGT